MTAVSPDGYSLDDFYMARPGVQEAQLDLLGDYASNVALYPKFQAYFRKYQPPLLAVWGRNDPRGDIPDAEVLFYDTGHFALETHAPEIAAAMGKFLDRTAAGQG